MLNKYEIQEFIDACCQILGIKSVPYSDNETFSFGEFCTRTRTIMINQTDLLTKGYNVYEIIAHECIHAKQFDDKRLRVNFRSRFIIFDGEKYSESKLGLMSYKDRPWEKEANDLMSEVATIAYTLLADKKNVA